MKATYISPSSEVVTFHCESALMQASSPSFDVDNSKESDVVLSNSSSWDCNSWAEADED